MIEHTDFDCLLQSSKRVLRMASSINETHVSSSWLLRTLALSMLAAGLMSADAKPVDEQWPRALDYYKYLHVDWKCHSPQPRVIPVQTIHPDAGVAYVTTCVVLHRCSADAGCCPETDTCVAERQEIVKIPIITHDARTPYRLLSFANHTVCHCVPKRKALGAEVQLNEVSLMDT